MFDYMTKKERMIIEYIKKHPYAQIGEISEKTYISKSSVDRCLDKYKNIIIPSTKLTIEEQMRENRIMNRKESSQELIKENEQKRQDIIFICNYYLVNYPMTLVEITKELEDSRMYTKSYIYKCLTDSRVVELLGKEKAKELSIKLKISRYALSRKRTALEKVYKKLKGQND